MVLSFFLFFPSFSFFLLASSVRGHHFLRSSIISITISIHIKNAVFLFACFRACPVLNCPVKSLLGVYIHPRQQTFPAIFPCHSYSEILSPTVGSCLFCLDATQQRLPPHYLFPFFPLFASSTFSSLFPQFLLSALLLNNFLLLSSSAVSSALLIPTSLFLNLPSPQSTFIPSFSTPSLNFPQHRPLFPNPFQLFHHFFHRLQPNFKK